MKPYIRSENPYPTSLIGISYDHHIYETGRTAGENDLMKYLVENKHVTIEDAGKILRGKILRRED